MNRLFIVRHGETEWSLNGRHTGFTDLPLTDNGQTVAKGLKARLANFTFALVLTSPLQRARLTCELAGLGKNAVVTEDLREFDYGDYEGLTTRQIREKAPGWTVFTQPCPHGETLARAGERAGRVVALARAAQGDVVAFTHGHFGRILAATWIEQPPAFGAHIVLDTGTLNILGWEHESPVIQTWNTR